MSDRMKSFYRSVWQNDTEISLRIYPVLLGSLHFRPLLDLWSILWVNPLEELLPSGPNFWWAMVINAKNLLRPEENASRHVPSPTACMGQFLCFSQVTLATPKV